MVATAASKSHPAAQRNRLLGRVANAVKGVRAVLDSGVATPSDKTEALAALYVLKRLEEKMRRKVVYDL